MTPLSLLALLLAACGTPSDLGAGAPTTPVADQDSGEPHLEQEGDSQHHLDATVDTRMDVPDPEEPAAPWGEDLVFDGGFEEEGLPAWTLSSAEDTCLRADADTVPGLDPAEGETYLRGNTRESLDCRVIQELSLAELGFPLTKVDSGQVGLFGEVWLGALSADGAFDDQAWLQVHFLDVDGAELTSLRSRAGATELWNLRGISGLVPPGTRTLQVEFVGIWRQSGGNDARVDALSLWLEQVEQGAPGILKQPMLQDTRTHTMRLLWETDDNLVENGVDFGLQGEALDRTVRPLETRQVAEGHFVHVAELPGLEPGTTYDYRVWSGETASLTWSFRTAPEADAPVTLAWTGDNHLGWEVFSQLAGLMAARGPDLHISAGDIANYGPDLTEEGELKEWDDAWFAPLETDGFSSQVPTMIARGNHEKHYEMGYAYTALPGNGAWYAFRYGPVAVLVLDSQTQHLADQTRFIEETLASEEFTSAAWRVVTFHIGPYSNATKSGTNGDGHADIRNNWVPLFEQGGVDLVVNAHFHSYQSGEHNGVTYAVVGGGGALFDTSLQDVWDFLDVYTHEYHYVLMEADQDTLTWTAYDLEDEPFDTWQLTR